MKMAESQGAHRMELERQVIANQLDESKRGQNYGLLIGLTGLAICLTLALTGHDVVAGVVGGTTLVGLVAVFVVGKKQQREDLASKS